MQEFFKLIRGVKRVSSNKKEANTGLQGEVMQKSQLKKQTGQYYKELIRGCKSKKECTNYEIVPTAIEALIKNTSKTETARNNISMVVSLRGVPYTIFVMEEETEYVHKYINAAYEYTSKYAESFNVTSVVAGIGIDILSVVAKLGGVRSGRDQVSIDKMAEVLKNVAGDIHNVEQSIQYESLRYTRDRIDRGHQTRATFSRIVRVYILYYIYFSRYITVGESREDLREASELVLNKLGIE